MTTETSRTPRYVININNDNISIAIMFTSVFFFLKPASSPKFAKNVLDLLAPEYMNVQISALQCVLCSVSFD